MVELRRRKLACFKKTRNGIMKKVDTTTTPGTKVNSSSLCPEDLVQLVDISVVSKYRANLTQFTCVVAEDMRSTLDAFKQDFNANLPRQVWTMVLQISGEAQGKHTEGVPMTPNQGGVFNYGNPGILANHSQSSPGGNLNLQQPYYQTMAYGPNIPPMGNGTPHGPMPDILFPRTPAYPTPNPGNDNYGGMTEGVREQIVRTLREFGFNPKGCSRAYQKPYPEYFDTIPYPWGFRIPDFMKFNGDDTKTTYEHM
jgi:hypothetical protein